MNRKNLEQPFPPDLIRTRKGAFGQTIAYVEAVEYIRRLNNAFESEWSFEIVFYQILDAEVLVMGKLQAGVVSKTAFGGSSITTARSTNKPMSIADDLKSAATDALKKAASMLGIGLHLYSGDKKPATQNGGNGRPQVVQYPAANNTNPNPTPATPNNDRLTQRQLSAIWKLGRSIGETVDQIRQRSLDRFGQVPEQLSRTEASILITEMNKMIGGNGKPGTSP